MLSWEDVIRESYYDPMEELRANGIRWENGGLVSESPEKKLTNILKDELQKVILKPSKPVTHLRSIPGIKKTVFNGDDTVIIWEDGKQTIVTREEGKPYDQYAAFTAAVCKRLFGGTGKVMDIMHKTDEGARAKAAAEKKRKAAEAEKARKAEAHKRKLELEEKRHHELVEEYLRKMRAEKEALAIISREKKEKGE